MKMIAYIFAISLIILNEVHARDCGQRLNHIIGNKEVRLFNEKVTYNEALAKCKSWGQKWKSGETGVLATIKTFEDQQCIQDMISISTNYRKNDWKNSNSITPGYYVGATDAESEGKWLWQDRTPVAGYTNWAYFEPNNSARHHQDCLQLLMTNTSFFDYKIGKWIDVPCNRKRFYVCERELDSQRNWGYENNAHALPPSQWNELYPSCSSEEQSPIKFDLASSARQCDTTHRFVKGWIVKRNAQWIVENTGRFIKVTVSPPNSTWTSFYGTSEKFFVDHFILKWGEAGSAGSDHTVGKHKATGELQIFHKRKNGVLHAFAFMLQEREHQNNQYWSNLLHSINQVQETGLTKTMQAERSGFRHLLRDSSSNSVSQRDILRSAIRYQGSIPHPPCSRDVLWSVHTLPINLSRFQFDVLRSMHSEDGVSSLSNNFRPTQGVSKSFCAVRQHFH